MAKLAASTSLTERTVTGFRDLTLPKNEWTHEAHLRVGLWHLTRYSPAEALDRLRDGIRAYNQATGVANTYDSGYHETTTRFYVLIIADFLEMRDRTRDLDELANELIAVRGDKRLPFRHYSEDLLMSSSARRRWIEPDLRPVPDSARVTPAVSPESES